MSDFGTCLWRRDRPYTSKFVTEVAEGYEVGVFYRTSSRVLVYKNLAHRAVVFLLRQEDTGSSQLENKDQNTLVTSCLPLHRLPRESHKPFHSLLRTPD